MKIPFSTVCQDFLALRGESPDLLPLLEEGEESAVLTLSRLLEAQLPQAARKATMAAPLWLLDELKTSDASMISDTAGIGILRLPDDFLRLHTLRMPDWREAVHATEPAGSLRRELGANAPEWMVCPMRPMAVEGSDTRGKFLRVFGSYAAGKPAEFIYVPVPEFDGETLTISKCVYPEFLSDL